MGRKPDWRDDLNLLERILVTGPLDDRRAPARSGEAVRGFLVIPPHPCVCLIYDTDPKQGWRPIEEGRQPDYVVLYVRACDVILTIVELKGRARGLGGDALEQITSLATRLRAWGQAWLPSGLRLSVQGLMLVPPGGGPTEREVRFHLRQKNPCPIGLLQVTSPPDLGAYVSHKLKQPWEILSGGDRRPPHHVAPNPLESLLSGTAKRPSREWILQKIPPAPAGLRLQFDLSEHTNFAKGSIAGVGLSPITGFHVVLAGQNQEPYSRLKACTEELGWSGRRGFTLHPG